MGDEWNSERVNCCRLVNVISGYTGKRLTFEKASFSRHICLLEISEASIRVLFGSTEITPKYIALAFTMLANILEPLLKESRHRAAHWFALRKNVIL
jgi:hypothetical protein